VLVALAATDDGDMALTLATAAVLEALAAVARVEKKTGEPGSPVDDNEMPRNRTDRSSLAWLSVSAWVWVWLWRSVLLAGAAARVVDVAVGLSSAAAAVDGRTTGDGKLEVDDVAGRVVGVEELDEPELADDDDGDVVELAEVADVVLLELVVVGSAANARAVSDVAAATAGGEVGVDDGAVVVLCSVVLVAVDGAWWSGSCGCCCCCAALAPRVTVATDGVRRTPLLTRCGLSG